MFLLLRETANGLRIIVSSCGICPPLWSARCVRDNQVCAETRESNLVFVTVRIILV